jgi:hypothetical protein
LKPTGRSAACAAIVLATLAAACASRPAVGRPEEGTTFEARSMSAPPVGVATLQQLTETVEQVDLEAQGVRAGAVRSVLAVLAKAVAELERSDRTASRMRVLIADHAGEDVSSDVYRRAVMRALGNAVSTVGAFGSRCGNTDVDEASRRAGLALARVDPTLPLTEQAEALQAAIRATVDAILLAAGRAPMFDVESEDAVAPEHEAGVPRPITFEDHSLAAHRALLELGGAIWSDARRIAGGVLLSWANALEAGGRDTGFEDQVREVRFQGERLGRLDGLPFARGSWIAAAVESALDALELLVAPERREVLTPWIERARTSARAVDPRGSLGFQRAAVQDALRSTTDAFLASVTADTAAAQE